MRELLFFDSMITPKIIVFIYWLSLFAVIISGLFYMFGPFGNFLMGLVIIVLGLISVRVWCELLIVIFKINDNLKKLANKE